jgi:signal transduction histidine kinase
VAVVLAAVFSMLLVTRLIGPNAFDRALKGADDTPASVLAHQVDRAYDASLQAALLVALVVAAVGSLLISRALLHPLDRIRAATRRIGAGHYGEHIPLPREPELARLAADVNQLAARLADTERRRARLLSEVAHEIRSPLAVIRGQLDGLADGIFPASAELFASLDEELARLGRLTSDMSSLSRAEEGAFDLRPVDTDLADLVRRTSARLRPQFDDQKVELTTAAAAPVSLRADPQRITQVVVNLLGNALYATDPGGQVTVVVRRDGGHAVLAVIDTGIGIAPDDLERIFHRFERVDHPGRAAPASGSGIGLTIARGIVRAHGGDITAASPGRGRGASVEVRLPVDGPARPDLVTAAARAGQAP